MNALLYGRVSTDKQELSQQETRCREYASFQRLTIAPEHELLDDDTSGSIAIWDRPKGKQLRRLLETQPEIRHLIVAKLDRLGRNAQDLLKTFHWLQSRGITLHIVDMGGDSMSTAGPAGRLMFTVLAAMAEFERDLIRDRIQQKLDERRQQNRVTGTVPYGWNAIDTGAKTSKGVPIRELVDNPEEQRWIIHMALRRWGSAGIAGIATGPVAGSGVPPEPLSSWHRIATELNALHVPTKQGAGAVIRTNTRSRKRAGLPPIERFSSGLWQSGNVAKILQSRTVREWLAQHPHQAAA